MDETKGAITKHRGGIVLRVVGGILLAMGLWSGVSLVMQWLAPAQGGPILPEGGRTWCFLGMWQIGGAWGHIFGAVEWAVLMFAGVQLAKLKRNGWVTAVALLGYLTLSMGLYLATDQAGKSLATIHGPAGFDAVLLAHSFYPTQIEGMNRIVLFFLSIYGTLWLYIVSEWPRFVGSFRPASLKWELAKAGAVLALIGASVGWTFWGANYVLNARVMREAQSAKPTIDKNDFEKLPGEEKYQVMAVMVKRLEDERTDDVAVAVQQVSPACYLKRLRQEDTAKIIEASRSKSVEVRKACCLLLQGIGTPEAEGRLRDMIDGPKDEAWHAAIDALGRLRPGKAPDVLIAAAKEELARYASGKKTRKDEGAATARLIDLTGFEDERVVGLALEAMKSSSPEVRSTAIGLIDRFPGQQAEEALTDGLKDPEAWVRARACAGLARIGTAKAIPALIELLKGIEDEYQDPYVAGKASLHEEAGFALAGITGREMTVEAGEWEKWWKENGAKFDQEKEMARRMFTPLPKSSGTARIVDNVVVGDPRMEAVAAQVHAIQAAESREMRELAPEMARYLELPDDQAGMKIVAAMTLTKWGYREGIGWLIARVANEEGKGDYYFRDMSTLGRATGVNFFGKQERWEEWWKVNRERFPSASGKGSDSKFGTETQESTAR